jgi:hypothetical protein
MALDRSALQAVSWAQAARPCGRLTRDEESSYRVVHDIGPISRSPFMGGTNSEDQSAAVASISDINAAIARRLTPSRVIGGAALAGPNRAASWSKCFMASSTSVV